MGNEPRSFKYYVFRNMGDISFLAKYMEKNSQMFKLGSCFELLKVKGSEITFLFKVQKIIEQNIIDVDGNPAKIEAIMQDEYYCDMVKTEDGKAVLAVAGVTTGINRLFKQIKKDIFQDLIFNVLKYDPLEVYSKLKASDDVMRVRCTSVKAKNVSLGKGINANVEIFDAHDSIAALKKSLNVAEFKANRIEMTFRYQDRTALIALSDTSKTSLPDYCRELLFSVLAPS